MALDTETTAYDPDGSDRLNYRALDPGIRAVVRLLRRKGFRTTDSGDGVSKPAVGRVFDFPHVAMQTHRGTMFLDATRCLALLRKHFPAAEWTVEATYWPATETCMVLAHCPPGALDAEPAGGKDKS